MDSMIPPRSDDPRTTNHRGVVHALITAAAISVAPAVAGADDPPAPPAGRVEPGKMDTFPGPMPIEVDPEKLRGRPAAVLETLASNQARAQERALAMVAQLQRQAAREVDPKIPIEKIPAKFRPADADRVREWAEELRIEAPFTLDQYHKLKAVYWMEVAARHARNVLVINEMNLD